MGYVKRGACLSEVIVTKFNKRQCWIKAGSI